MTPKHDEIVKHLDDGFTLAWDSTKVDRVKARAARRVARQRAAALGEIIGPADGVPRDRAVAEAEARR